MKVMTGWGGAFVLYGLAILLFGGLSGVYTFKGSERYWNSAIFILVGIVLIARSWAGSRLEKGKEKFEELPDPSEEVVVCPHCGTPYSLADVPERRCPKCDVQLEELEGFYKRHPELK